MRISCIALPQSARIVLAFLFFIIASFIISEQSPADEEFEVLPPPVLKSTYYPCSRCHDSGTETGKKYSRPEHRGISAGQHVESAGCKGCHDPLNPSQLLLFDGRKVSLSDSHMLCGQCHQKVFRRWQIRLHGKGGGRWDGKPAVAACTSCHGAHNPQPAPIKPETPPVRPGETLRWRR